VIEELDGLPPLAVHPLQLETAIDALLDNALRASRRGASVILRARREDDDVRLEVVDEGAGMTPEVMKRAVEIGFSTSGRRGVGLSVAKFVAYAHGGGFQVSSRPGEGTTVALILPVG
jgi:signal transduction histidine kinase